MWRKYVADREPAAVAVCFDRYEKTFREEMDAAYKAQRQAMPDDLVPQIEDAKRLCRLLGLAVLEEPGFEADDLIGSIAVVAKEAGFRAEICSADKDLFQLVKDPDVAVFHPVKEVLLDEAGVLDVLRREALSGHRRPRPHGRLVRQHPRRQGRRREDGQGAHRDVRFPRRDLRAPRRGEGEEEGAPRPGPRGGVAFADARDGPLRPASPGEAADLLEHFRIRPLDPKAVQDLAAFYDEMGFSRVKKELLESAPPTKGPAGKAAASSEPATLSLFEESPSSNANHESVRWLADAAGLDALVASAVKAGRASVHVECGPGCPWPAPPLAAAVAIPGGDAAAFALDAAGTKALAALFAQVFLVTHDAKRLFLAADALGIPPPARYFDAMLASYVVAPGIHAHDLAGDARGVLNLPPESVPPLKELNGGAPSSAATFASEDGRRWLEAARPAPARSRRRPRCPPRGRLAARGVSSTRSRSRSCRSSRGWRSRASPSTEASSPASRRSSTRASPLSRRRSTRRPGSRSTSARRCSSGACSSRGSATLPRQEDREDEVVRDGLRRPRGARRALERAGAGARPRVAGDLEAEGDVRRRAPRVHRGGRPHPHPLRPGRRGHGPAVVERAEPAEHPDPHGGGPRDPPRVRRAGGEEARRGGLLADRAEDPRAPLGGRGAPRGLPAGRGHPPRHGREDLRPRPRGRHARTSGGARRRSTSASSTAWGRSPSPRSSASRAARRRSSSRRISTAFRRSAACLDAILEKARATGGTETIFGRVRPIPGPSRPQPQRSRERRTHGDERAVPGFGRRPRQEGDARPRRRALRGAARGAAPPAGPRRARPRGAGGARGAGGGPRAPHDGGRREL